MSHLFVNLFGQNLTEQGQAGSYALALSHEIAEMVVDPLASLQNPEVCDPCGPNCQQVYLDYFDGTGSYIETSQAFPPGFAYGFLIDAIAYRLSGPPPHPGAGGRRLGA